MTKYKIIDNFLNDSDFTELTGNILPIPTVGIVGNSAPSFGWDYNGTSLPTEYDEQDRFKKVTDIERSNPINDWHLSRMIYLGFYRNQALQYFGPLLDKINPIALFKIQANLTVQQEKRRRSLFHVDYDQKSKQSMITSIFYMNTTNGPTILEDGIEIECRANRLVSFPQTTYHAGVVCTDQPYRMVINLNYFKDLELP